MSWDAVQAKIKWLNPPGPKLDHQTSRFCEVLAKSLLIGYVSLTFSIVASAQDGANKAPRLRPQATGADDTQAKDASDRDCATRFPAFVQELDRLLASDPSTIYPVFDLLNRYFPVQGCDIQNAIRVARESRFFSHVSEETTYYIIAFDSRGFAGPADPGFHVQLSLLKASGDSRLPAAHVNQ
jgi:hypothetical protein